VTTSFWVFCMKYAAEESLWFLPAFKIMYSTFCSCGEELAHLLQGFDYMKNQLLQQSIGSSGETGVICHTKAN